MQRKPSTLHNIGIDLDSQTPAYFDCDSHHVPEMWLST